MITASTPKTRKTLLLISCFLVAALVLPIGSARADDQDTESIEILRKVGKAFSSIAGNASPAVVGISSQLIVERQSSMQHPFGDPFDDEFFRRFFGQPYRHREAPKRKSLRPVQGSGFLVSADGHILTNSHVVQNADSITVTLKDGREFSAKTIGTDPDTEVAVVKIDTNDLPHLELEDSDKLEVGEWVIAIGNPFGLSHTVTAGIVSAKGRDIDLAVFEDFIQHTAAINPGNSGGPLLNLDGKVVGINTAIIGPGGNIGIGLAIPINLVKFVYDKLIKGEPIARGMLGIGIEDLSSDMAEILNLKNTKGVIITDVHKDSAADKAKLKRYDVIIEFNGEKVELANELKNRVSMVQPGTKVKLVVIRDGKKKTIEAELGSRSETMETAKTSQETLEKLGFEVQDLTENHIERYGYEWKSGVVVSSVESGSQAARKGLKRGLLIMEVNRKPVKNKKEFNDAMEKAAESGKVLLHVGDARYHDFIVLNIPKD
jgi:serine protease Do